MSDPTLKCTARFIMPVILVLLIGCSGDDDVMGPAAPDPDPVLSCETNNTATVVFENRSNTNSTYDIIWDGSKVATVTPGNKTESFTVAAGIQHTLLYKYTNTNNLACTQATPTYAQCASRLQWCTG